MRATYLGYVVRRLNVTFSFQGLHLTISSTQQHFQRNNMFNATTSQRIKTINVTISST